MSTPTEVQLDDVKQHLLEVGLVCSQWAHLEWLLELTLWWLLGLLNRKTEGRAVTSQWSIDTMARKACELAHLRISDPADRAILISTRDRMTGVLQERNLAVHGVRLMNPETKFITAEIARGSYKNTAQSLSLIRLTSLNAEIAGIISALQPLLIRLGVIEDIPRDANS